MVTTPEPPMPATSTLQRSPISGRTGSGTGGRARGAAASGLRGRPPWTVTKLGQKPSTQVKSLLQLDWLMRRLRPHSVSSGSIAMQLETLPQSPQPSHTSGWMKVRIAGSAHLPRLRRRRRSVAQGWS